MNFFGHLFYKELLNLYNVLSIITIVGDNSGKNNSLTSGKLFNFSEPISAWI